MARRTDVVDSGVNRLHAGLANVADLETSLAALVRRSNRTSTSTEVALSALCSRLCEARRAAVVARSTGSALGDIVESDLVIVGSVGTEELRVKLSAFRTVAAWGTVDRISSIKRTVESLRT